MKCVSRMHVRVWFPLMVVLVGVNASPASTYCGRATKRPLC